MSTARPAGEDEQHHEAQHGHDVGDDPVRLAIVARLAAAGPDGELACGTFALPVSKSTQSGHFKVLRETGVIHQRDEGTRRMNRLRRDDLDARFPGLLDLALRHGRDAIGSGCAGSEHEHAPARVATVKTGPRSTPAPLEPISAGNRVTGG